MSEAQLQKVRDEKKFLESEVASLEQSSSCEDAAKKMMAFISGAPKPDPFENHSDNEWVKSGDGGGACCVIS